MYLLLSYIFLSKSVIIDCNLSEIKKLPVFMIRLLFEKHFFITFRYITADDIINMPSVDPHLTVRIDVSVVIQNPSILIFFKYKSRFIQSVSVIIDRIHIIIRLIMSPTLCWTPLNIFITEHYPVSVFFLKDTNKL